MKLFNLLWAMVASDCANVHFIHFVLDIQFNFDKKRWFLERFSIGVFDLLCFKQEHIEKILENQPLNNNEIQFMKENCNILMQMKSGTEKF
ncbi:hypothetical protein HUJ05_010416 [Dendroctonus ponderosae]|nr:hypothetical protein HUJ05_010416 [Dendroctonus ponderosae]